MYTRYTNIRAYEKWNQNWYIGPEEQQVKGIENKHRDIIWQERYQKESFNGIGFCHFTDEKNCQVNIIQQKWCDNSEIKEVHYRYENCNLRNVYYILAFELGQNVIEIH